MTLITAVFGNFASRAWNYNSIFNLISAVSFFLFFKSLDLKENKFINYIASFSLVVYIIHENEFICKRIYRGIFKTIEFRDTVLLVPHVFVTCIGIFAGCVIIEIVRRKLCDSVINKVLDKIDFCNKDIIVK